MVQMERPRPRRRWWIWLAAISVLLAGAYLLLQPRVVEVAPTDGATGISAATSIEIQFNRPMNPASVERRLEITPEVDGSFSWQGNRLAFEPASSWPEGEVIRVRLRTGASSALSLPLIVSQSWQFQVGQPRILYLSGREGPSQLEARVLTEPQAETLVDSSGGIIDYELAPEFSMLLTLELQPDNSTAFIRRDLNGRSLGEVHRCSPDQRCRQPGLSTDGNWLAWQQQSVERTQTGIVNTGPWQIMLMQLEAGTTPVTLPESGEIHSPQWLPSNRLAVYSDQRSALMLYELSEDGAEWNELTQIAHQLGGQWSWSPEGRFVVFPEVILLEATEVGVDFFSHLFRVEAESGLSTDLSGSQQRMVEDASPAYSPDGLQIAFARKSLDPAEWALGRQLWVMAADGSNAVPLTNEPNFNHASIRWHPEGNRLLYVRFNQASLDAPTEVWWYDFRTEQHQLAVEGGFSARWMP